MRGASAISTILFIVILAVGYGIEYVSYGHNIQGLWVLGIAFLIALYVSSSLKIADQWDRAVVLCQRRFNFDPPFIKIAGRKLTHLYKKFHADGLPRRPSAPAPV